MEYHPLAFIKNSYSVRFSYQLLQRGREKETDRKIESEELMLVDKPKKKPSKQRFTWKASCPYYGPLSVCVSCHQSKTDHVSIVKLVKQIQFAYIKNTTILSLLIANISGANADETAAMTDEKDKVGMCFVLNQSLRPYFPSLQTIKFSLKLYM